MESRAWRICRVDGGFVRMSSVRSASGTAYLIFQKLQMKECTRVRSNTTPEVEWTEADSKRAKNTVPILLLQFLKYKKSLHLVIDAKTLCHIFLYPRFTLFFYIFYSRNPLISLIRDKIVLQLQLITPGRASMTLCRKCSISSLDEATACTCSLSLPVTR